MALSWTGSTKAVTRSQSGNYLTLSLMVLAVAAVVPVAATAQAVPKQAAVGQTIAEQTAPVPTVALNREQAVLLAEQRLRAGDAPAALLVLENVITYLGDSHGVRLLQSSAAQASGDLVLAAKAAKQAWRLATDRTTRFRAAQMAAQVAARRSRKLEVKLWLRRTTQNAPNDRVRAMVARDYRIARRYDPWQRRFSFSLTPSNNLNGGSSSDVLIVDGVDLEGVLSPDAQALSGLRLRAGVDLKYRLKPTSRSMTSLGFRSDITRNYLSSDAQDLAPDVRNSELNYTLSEVSISQKRALAARPGGGTAAVLSYGAAVGQTWYGGEDLTSYQRLNLGWARNLAAGKRLSTSATVESQTALTSGSSDSLSWKLGGRFGRPMGNGDRISFSLGATLVDADSINSTWRGLDLGLIYQIKAPLAGAQLSLSLGLDYRDYSAFDLGIYMAPGGRQDQGVRAGITAVLPQIQYMGFAPVLSLDLARRRSNVSRYESRDLGLGLSFRSAF
ncbi:hypothetical protein [Candidatus Halocynthiibacter alkanivorans]|uniref:hypothetical protein n=1 Tax=Candidatus Halocynthiibacter alkanivorans TaxID=2267619 RepID=UPI00109D31B9|nr:hypothetical protein [Candidatus Halocynthiibacter alkanivorans]